MSRMECKGDVWKRPVTLAEVHTSACVCRAGEHLPDDAAIGAWCLDLASNSIGVNNALAAIYAVASNPASLLRQLIIDDPLLSEAELCTLNQRTQHIGDAVAHEISVAAAKCSLNDAQYAALAKSFQHHVLLVWGHRAQEKRELRVPLQLHTLP